MYLFISALTIYLALGLGTFAMLTLGEENKDTRFMIVVTGTLTAWIWPTMLLSALAVALGNSIVEAIRGK